MAISQIEATERKRSSASSIAARICFGSSPGLTASRRKTLVSSKRRAGLRVVVKVFRGPVEVFGKIEEAFIHTKRVARLPFTHGNELDEGFAGAGEHDLLPCERAID